MPSSKTTTTCDSPNFEIERSFSSPGKPLIDCSMGNVICRSTSSGESDGAVVLICTITGVVSGKASMSMYCSDHAPAAITTATATRTTIRFRSEKSMIQFNMSTCPDWGETAKRIRGCCVSPAGFVFRKRDNGNRVRSPGSILKCKVTCVRSFQPDRAELLLAQSPSAEIALEQLSPQHATSFGHNDFTRQQTSNHFGIIALNDSRTD